jgi:SagB-type dehydrogenase family enzyme
MTPMSAYPMVTQPLPAYRQRPRSSMHVPTARVPARVRLWSLSEDVLMEVESDGERLVAFTQWGEIMIEDPSPLVRESLQRMSLGPVSVENLAITPETHGDVLDQLGCCIVQSLGLDDEAGPVLSVVPVTRRAPFWVPVAIGLDDPVRLSRFAAMRAADGELLLESPVTQYRVVAHRPVVAWIVASLATVTTVNQLAAQLRIAPAVLADIMGYLVGSGTVLVAVAPQPGAPAAFGEDTDPELAPWSHHDLLFHAYSRLARHVASWHAASGHSAHAERLPIAPLTRPPRSGPRFRLYRPDLEHLAASDPPLAEVVEPRRAPAPDEDYPPTAEQLGELLFRVARIRWIERATAGLGGATYAVSHRPYLSTADLYELELYVSVDRCDGLPRGCYHYDPREHTLTLVNDSDEELTEVMDTAKVAAGSTRRPPVLITMTTLIGRLSWMYSSVAYSTTLKHVGGLQQSLYLAATAMGLTSCALAVGDSAAIDEALRLEWPTEVSVGEFAVGVRP